MFLTQARRPDSPSSTILAIASSALLSRRSTVLYGAGILSSGALPSRGVVGAGDSVDE